MLDTAYKLVLNKIHFSFFGWGEPWGRPHSYPLRGPYGQSEGLTERINEPPWGRCLQGAVDVRWVVVLLLLLLLCCCCRRRPTGGSGLTSSRALGSTVTLLRSNGDASMGLDDQAMR